jgi:hypothetical protein
MAGYIADKEQSHFIGKCNQSSPGLIIVLIHHSDAPKCVTAFGILIQATGNSQKLRNHVLKIPMQPDQALYARFTNKMYGHFQSSLLLY